MYKRSQKLNHFVSLVGILIASFLPTTAYGCAIPDPIADDLSAYDQIIIGEVTKIHLLEYENGKLNCNDPSQICVLSSSTMTFSVNVVVYETLQGNHEQLKSIELGGCGARVPKLRDVGMFLIDLEGTNKGFYPKKEDLDMYKDKITKGRL